MHAYEQAVFSRRKAPSKSYRMPGVFWFAMIAAVVLSVFMLSQQISAGDETPPAAAGQLEEITIITTEACPACLTLKEEWQRNGRARKRLQEKARVKWVQIETVPAGVNSRGKIVPLNGIASLDHLLKR